ncbi:MAG: response regulator [Candidatus Eremiobacteraeota bacterium]|nr:response regulator [Candidatus Eremiobacteraeota bacterium]MCW5869328.1 response regulator [Candidatus Eremiobacteraeota bacterium]
MRERILILSADAHLRQWLVDILRSGQASLDTAAHGAAGLALLAEKDFDLVLVDLDLPGMDGLETLARIKNHAGRTGSVVLARKQSEELLLRAMRSGGGDFLRIPCNPEEVSKAAQRQLRLSLALRQGPDRNDGSRKTLVRAFQAICLSLDLQNVPGRPLPGLQPLGLLARQVALGLKLSETAREEVQLATWIQAICELPGEAPVLIDWEELPAGVQTLLEGGEGPAAELVKLALALGRGEDIYEKDRFPTEYLELIPKGPQFKQVQRRAQISRARALQGSGQALEAIHLFEQVHKADPNSPEVLLALARLHRRPELVQQALNCSQKLGAWITAETCFEAGLVLHELNAPGADNQFLRSSRLYGDLRSRHRQALALLAQEWVAGLRLPGDGVRMAIEDLCECPEPELLSAQLDWLAPGLLAYPGLEATEAPRLVQRWLEEDSSRIAQEIRRGNWSLEARKGLARVLAGLPWVAGREVLEVLEKDHSQEVRAAVPADIHVGSALPPILRVHALGPLEVYQGRRRLPNNAWRTQRARQLVAYLATHWQEAHSEEALIELFLPDSPSPVRLQQLLEVARSSLRPAGWPEVNYLLWEAGRLRFNLQLPRWVDVEQLEYSFARAQQCQGEQAAEHYRRVLAVAGGEFLEDFEADWVLPRRVRLREQLVAARFWLARWALESGRPAEALEHAQFLLENDPGCEETWVLSMDSLLALNRIEEALRTSERAKKAIGEPGPLLKEAHRRAVASLA